MKNYDTKAVQSHKKRIEKEIRKAFKHNQFKWIKLESFAVRYEGDNDIHRTQSERLKEEGAICREQFKNEIVRGAGTIYWRALREIQREAVEEQKSYELALFLDTKVTFLFYNDWLESIKVKATIVMDINLKDPCEIFNGKEVTKYGKTRN